MRIATFIFGIGGALLGIYGLVSELTAKHEQDRILGLSLALLFILAGCGLCVSAVLRYRGGWLTVIGTVVLVFCIGCIAAKVNERLVPSYDAAFGFPVIVLSAVCASILLLFGHRRHRKISGDDS